MIGKDSKQIYSDENIKLSFYGEHAYNKFIIIFHIINPLKFLIIGMFLGIFNVLFVEIFKLSWYIAGILPTILMMALYGYRKYQKKY